VSPFSADYLVVAGGGGGGGFAGGGGGAGGYRTSFPGGTKLSLTAGTSYPVTVGAGGARFRFWWICYLPTKSNIRNRFNIFNNYINRWWRRY
jgi:hypothetical protein